VAPPTRRRRPPSRRPHTLSILILRSAFCVQSPETQFFQLFAGWAGPGFRSASYDPAVVRDYGKLGKPPQNTINGAGEIFAAALIRFNEFLGAKLGDPQKGHCIGWRAVVESLRLIEANPHFLQGRDALLGGIDELEQGALIDGPEAAAARAAAREAFARYGMGKNAKSPNASFKGTVGDTTI